MRTSCVYCFEQLITFESQNYGVCPACIRMGKVRPLTETEKFESEVQRHIDEAKALKPKLDALGKKLKDMHQSILINEAVFKARFPEFKAPEVKHPEN